MVVPSGSKQEDTGNHRYVQTPKRRWRGATGSFGSLFRLRLLNEFRQLRVPNAVAMEIHEEDRDTVFYRAFP